MAKKYSVNIENDEVISVEVDGVEYINPDEIPDPVDREKVYALISRSVEDEFEPDFGPEFDREFEELEKKHAKFPTLFFGIFFSVAVLMLAIAAFATNQTLRTLSSEQSAPGQVVEMVERSSYDDETRQSQVYYYPVVEFSLPGGESRRVQLNEGSWPPAYGIGDEVTILYDPQRPRNARIDSLSSTILMWLVPGITGVLGLSFLVVSLAIVWMRRSERVEPKSETLTMVV